MLNFTTFKFQNEGPDHFNDIITTCILIACVSVWERLTLCQF